MAAKSCLPLLLGALLAAAPPISRAAGSFPEEHSPAAADRLRGDAVQTARVRLPYAAKPLKPVRLDRDEQAVARYINSTWRVGARLADRFVHYAFKAAREFRLDPPLVRAVIAVESSFDYEAQSPAGAQGLMQVLTRLHASKFDRYGGIEAAWEPLANIRVGTRILSEYIARYGDVASGLKAYVGAALMSSDGGYGDKVLNRRAEFDAVVRALDAPAMQARADRVPEESTVASDSAGGKSLGL
jgi:soluble lytic murein transglycosylase-like protein